ncbi:MAG: hypothetical protein A2051_11230 [Desulfovibrionales bacterium GWA2_65_9]|nr:MAG: hypothetical protein A2051_11230 [Desulfovibrionales bacterium GWA2_65_9]
MSNYDSVSIAFMSHNTIFDMPEYYHLRKETVILIIQLHYFHMRIQAYQMILKNTRATGLQSVGIVINRMFYTCLITAALVQ